MHHCLSVHVCIICPPTDVMCDVVKDGGVHWVLQLLDSTHTIMTNEGLLALNLLAGLSNGE